MLTWEYNTIWLSILNIIEGSQIFTFQLCILSTDNNLRAFSKHELFQKIETYFKFLFVRNPLDRLLSAYRDMFTQYSKYTHFISNEIWPDNNKTLSSTPWQNFTKNGSDVTFAEFVKYLLDLSSRKEQFNPHWLPCKILYDVIGKMETIQSDSTLVLRWIQTETCNTSFTSPQKESPQTRNVLAQYYRHISQSDVEQIIKVHKRDFMLFD